MQSIKVFVTITILLAIIFGLSTYTSHNLNEASYIMNKHIDKANSHLRNANWSDAKSEIEIVKKEWDSRKLALYMLIDHLEIENIAHALAKMETYIEKENSTLALSESAVLKEIVMNMPQKDSLTLKNIF